MLILCHIDRSTYFFNNKVLKENWMNTLSVLVQKASTPVLFSGIFSGNEESNCFEQIFARQLTNIHVDKRALERGSPSL